MDTPCSEIDSQNNNNNNSKSECTHDTNLMRPSDSDEQNNNATELFDIDSSDLEYDCSDSDQDEINMKSKSAEDVENKTLSDEVLNDDNHGEVFIASDSEKCHSDEKVSDIQLEQLNSMQNASKQANNCSEQEERKEENEEEEESKVALIDDNAVEEEPIFDFLGKANEIVCYAHIFSETYKRYSLNTTTPIHS